MPYVKLSSTNQNLNLYYELHGTGDEKILFIMGLLVDGVAWFRQTQFFAELSDYQCVSFDNRGIGRSSSPLTLHYSTSQMAKDALALLNHLQWSQCHIVGISMGGMIGIELALIAPEKVRSLTLLATHAGGLVGQAPLIGIRHMIGAIFSRDEHSIVENALAMLYSTKTLKNPEKRQSFYDYHIEKFRNRISPTIIGLIGQLTCVFRHYVSYADLLKIRYSPFQCLIMVGTEDRLVREKNSYIIRRALGCQLVRLDDAGHGIQAECADEINQELLKFYKSIRKHKLKKREIPNEYPTEIQAVERCCQHRTHCFVYDILGFIQGLLFGLIVYSFFSLTHLFKVHLTCQSILLFGCLNGIRRSLKCIVNAFRARRFIRQHRLQLDRASHHGGIGINLSDENKNGIPHDCGFEFPILPLIFFANLISLIYWIRLIEQTNFNK